MMMNSSKRVKWTFEKIHAVALQYETRGEFAKGNPNAHRTAIRIKVINQVCSHMKQLHTKWTFEKLQEEALKYKFRGEFQKGNPNAHRAAIRIRVINQICSHMKFQRIKWTFDKIHQEALKYETRIDFAKNNNKAYQAALDKNILDQVCSHIKRITGTSQPEKELFLKIKESFPKVKKLVDRKAKIHGKLHIKGFDIDIYIPYLKKGIEFDGKYWHSFETMKSSRPHWPEEDVRNYHEIKDNYFLEKGIEIIHIKEEDWNKDSAKCLERVLKFLKNDQKPNIFSKLETK